jgi:hypothetical protein
MFDLSGENVPYQLAKLDGIARAFEALSHYFSQGTSLSA